ncbi:hypothetical protein [Stutzerimonas xanthomarina]|uniref:hypothetical protein n=1 Tax=Stutzerimonas xanthomarina TaxID=271420 RepID=UPI003AA9452B
MVILYPQAILERETYLPTLGIGYGAKLLLIGSNLQGFVEDWWFIAALKDFW